MLRDAGFEQIEVVQKPQSAEIITEWMPGSGAEDYVVSANVTAVKPFVAAVPSPACALVTTKAPTSKAAAPAKQAPGC